MQLKEFARIVLQDHLEALNRWQRLLALPSSCPDVVEGMEHSKQKLRRALTELTK
jgi:hypothetical protein